LIEIEADDPEVVDSAAETAAEPKCTGQHARIAVKAAKSHSDLRRESLFTAVIVLNVMTTADQKDLTAEDSAADLKAVEDLEIEIEEEIETGKDQICIQPSVLNAVKAVKSLLSLMARNLFIAVIVLQVVKAAIVSLRKNPIHQDLLKTSSFSLMLSSTRY
jgi:hypothetical protein